MRLWRRGAGPDPDACEQPWRVREVPLSSEGQGAWQVCDLCGAMRLEGPEEMGGHASEQAAGLMKAPGNLLHRIGRRRPFAWPTATDGSSPRQGRLEHESRRDRSDVRRSPLMVCRCRDPGR